MKMDLLEKIYDDGGNVDITLVNANINLTQLGG